MRNRNLETGNILHFETTRNTARHDHVKITRHQQVTGGDYKV